MASGFSRKALWLLLAAAVAVYFVGLGNASIWDANEAFYVETPREMMEAHDFINPSFNYLPRFNKPVLSYWIVSALYKLFGVSVGAQRLGIALGAIVIIASAYALGSMFDDRRATAGESRPSIIGLWSAVGLAAAPRVMMFARRIFIDVWITAFLSLTLTFFGLSERHPEQRRRWLVLMYVAVGLGMLTKGPVAIALPGLAFTLYLIVTKQLARVRHMMLPVGALIVFAIVVPWYAALYHQHGWLYIKSFFIGENVERFTSGLGVRQKRGLLFYLPVVLSDSFPWSFLLAPAFVAWRRRREAGNPDTLLWCWIVAIVGFFSFSAGKQDLYIFPIVAAVAALAGVTMHRAADDDRIRRWVTGTLLVTGALLAAAGAAVLLLFQAAGRVYALDGTLTIGALGVFGGLAALAFAFRRRPAAAAMAVLASVIAIDWTFVLRVLPDFERYKPVPAFSRVLEQRLRPEDAVADFQVALPSMVFYLRRHVDEYFDTAPFLDAVRSKRRLYAVLSADDYAELAPDIAQRTCVLDRRPTFDVRLRRVLAREPLPELLLITNDCPLKP